jgi:alpha-L-fucosidase 2
MHDNLWTTHPPFQIDGNLGITAGITEILLQSHAGEISLLPALPSTWPTGSVTGLRARGGVIIDVIWRNGKLSSAILVSTTDQTVRVRLPGEKTTREIKLTNATPFKLEI